MMRVRDKVRDFLNSDGGFSVNKLTSYLMMIYRKKNSINTFRVFRISRMSFPYKVGNLYREQ